jgi:hypothetical protein
MSFQVSAKFFYPIDADHPQRPGTRERSCAHRAINASARERNETQIPLRRDRAKPLVVKAIAAPPRAHRRVIATSQLAE